MGESFGIPGFPDLLFPNYVSLLAGHFNELYCKMLR